VLRGRYAVWNSGRQRHRAWLAATGASVALLAAIAGCSSASSSAAVCAASRAPTALATRVAHASAAPARSSAQAAARLISGLPSTTGPGACVVAPPGQATLGQIVSDYAFSLATSAYQPSGNGVSAVVYGNAWGLELSHVWNSAVVLAASTATGHRSVAANIDRRRFSIVCLSRAAPDPLGKQAPYRPPGESLASGQAHPGRARALGAAGTWPPQREQNSALRRARRPAAQRPGRCTPRPSPAPSVPATS
jgi:hypothetical protein